MAISEIVDVSLAETSEGATLESFDTPAIVAGAADTTPDDYVDNDLRAKEYSADSDGLEAIAEDWGDDSEAYAEAAAMVAQEPRPATLIIIARDPAENVEKKITFSGALGVGHSVSGVCNGQAFGPIAYNASEAATLTAIAGALSALEGVGTCTTDAATHSITVPADDEWQLELTCSTSGTTPPTATISTTDAGRTIADDIADAIAEDDTNKWYGLVLADSDKGAQLAAAAYLETTEKLLLIDTDESASKTAGGSTALAIRLAGKNYRRTIGLWHHDLSERAAAALLAVYLGKAPGSTMLAHRELAGVTPTPTSQLSTSQIATLEGRNFNTYRKFGQFGMVRKGRRVDGKVADATRDLDYARNEYRVAFLLYLSQTDKPPLDEGGLAQIQAIGEEVTRRLVSERIFRADKPATFSVPKLTDLSPSDLDAQIVAGCKVKATLLKGVLEVEINMEPVI